MLTSLFDYHLPPELIAQKPAGERDRSRLMVLQRATGDCGHHFFSDLPRFLEKGDLIVMNDTRVIPARIFAEKDTGATVEMTLMEKRGDDKTWRCLARPGKRLKKGLMLDAGCGVGVRAVEKLEDGSWVVKLIADGDLYEVLGKTGRAPLPPYIRRSPGDPRDEDLERYQTVYAREFGAVAAPTAGLHFTSAVLDEIRRKGVRTATLTLHVGWGSFAPVRTEVAEDHRVESEYFEVSEETAKAINDTREAGGRIVAVGTTSVRAVESACLDGEVMPMRKRTDLYILPGYKFKIVDAVVTNFHLPCSSLLMLVAAFTGREMILDAYREAVAEGYRFYSYGDAMLIC